MPCVAGHTEDETGLNFGRLVTSPELAAYRVITTAEEENIANQIDTPGLVAVLREQFASVNRNDLSHAEAMLIGQATALQTLFSRLASKAMAQPYHEQYGITYADGATRAEPMPHDVGNLEHPQESARGLCQASQHQQRAATNQQPHGYTLTGAGNLNRSKPTIGAATWRTAGPWNGANGNRN